MSHLSQKYGYTNPSYSNETLNNIEAALAKLPLMLDQLKRGEIEAIEYGTDGDHFGLMSAYYIRWMNTAGGAQFGLHYIERPRGFGSGFYSPHAEALIQEARKQLLYFHRPQPGIDRIRQELEKKRIARGEKPMHDKRQFLTFFAVGPASMIKQVFAPPPETEFDRILGNAETITISLDD